MWRVITVAAGLWLAGNGLAAAQSTECGARGPIPKPGEIKFVSWNIAELATTTQVYDRPIRSDAQFADLRMYRECNSGDVYALQEIASLRALARVFPPSSFILCISGQTVADQRGLSPDYPRDKLAGVAPQCANDAGASADGLPDELTKPGRQYTALAIRRSTGISIADVRDFVDLGIKDPNTGQPVRWGLDVTLMNDGTPLRMMVVHLKSRCTEEPIQEPSSSEHCPALSRQMPHLKNWILEASRSGMPVVVAGDFNRRLDVESQEVKPTDMWDVITGAATAGSEDDVRLAHVPAGKEFKCWPQQSAGERFAIDFFVLNQAASDRADASSYWKWRYGKDIAAGTGRPAWPSDHCAIQLNIKLP